MKVIPWPELPPATDPWPEPPPRDPSLREVHRAVEALLRGEGSAQEVVGRARPLGLLAPLPPDPLPPQPVDEVPPLAWIARVGTDFQPDLGDAPDRLLGPWFEALDHRPAHRRTLLVALAAMCFVPTEEHRRAFMELCRRKPLAPAALRARFRAVDRAPMSIWRLVREEEGWILEDRVGLSPPWVPDGPVRLDEYGAVAGGPRPGDTLVARVVPTRRGFVAAVPFVIPGSPSRALVRSWVAVEGIRARLSSPDIPLERMLRQRGHVLARRVHEWAWLG